MDTRAGLIPGQGDLQVIDFRNLTLTDPVSQAFALFIAEGFCSKTHS